MLAEIARYAAGSMLVVGALFTLVAAIGVVRMPDLHTRLHAVATAGAPGAGLILLAVAVMAFDAPVILRAVAGVAFLLLTAPVAAHLLARAAHGGGVEPSSAATSDDLEGSSRNNQ